MQCKILELQIVIKHLLIIFFLENKNTLKMFRFIEYQMDVTIFLLLNNETNPITRSNIIKEIHNFKDFEYAAFWQISKIIHQIQNRRIAYQVLTNNYL